MFVAAKLYEHRVNFLGAPVPERGSAKTAGVTRCVRAIVESREYRVQTFQQLLYISIVVHAAASSSLVISSISDCSRAVRSSIAILIVYLPGPRPLGHHDSGAVTAASGSIRKRVW